jgi:hypothetical protein
MRFWQFTIRQWAKWKLNVLKRVAIEIFVSLIIGVVFGLFGPFGTFSAPLGLRVLYWVVFIVAGYTLFRPTLIVSEWLADHIGMSIWIAKALAIGVASLPMTLLVAWMLDGFQIKAALTSNALPYFYGQVVLVSLIVNFIYDLLFTRHPPDRHDVNRSTRATSLSLSVAHWFWPRSSAFRRRSLRAGTWTQSKRIDTCSFARCNLRNGRGRRLAGSP